MNKAKTSRIRGQRLGSQAREIVANVLRYMTKEAETREFLSPVQRIQERVANATGISIRSVQRIIRERAENTEIFDSKTVSSRKVTKEFQQVSKPNTGEEEEVKFDGLQETKPGIKDLDSNMNGFSDLPIVKSKIDDESVNNSDILRRVLCGETSCESNDFDMVFIKDEIKLEQEEY